jgi:heat shock protein HtpX
LAHELAHVKHRDTLISTISATVAGAIASFARFGAMGGRRGGNPIVGLLTMFLAPMAASLIQMTISRGLEYEADRVGAKITKDPKALASALEKIQNFAR